MSIGLDFGTTNTSVALASAGNGPVHLTQFNGKPVCRSALYVYTKEEGGLEVLVGPEAMQAYAEDKGEGRLVKSIKNFLTSKTFSSTQISGKRYELEDLIALVVKRALSETEKQFGTLSLPLTVGRPVRFVGQETPEDEEIALKRLREGIKRAGVTDIQFELEPIAAAYLYESRLSADELILVADFGGGTSDFCIAKVGPGCKKLASYERILATSGVGVAGDAFDGCLVAEAVTPLLGNSPSIPRWIFNRFSRLATIPSLRDPKNLKIIWELSLERDAHPGLESLYQIVKENSGYKLFEKISEAKARLSSERDVPFRFVDEDVELATSVTSSDFENWLFQSLEEIRTALMLCLSRAELSPHQIDRVFLTGGSALVPAVRSLFSNVFGEEKMSGGDEFTSVAAGLVLRGSSVDAR